MLVWIASYSRSGNTLFRVALTHVYDVNTYAAFHAGENLIRANIQGFVNHKELPEPLRSAIEREGRHGEEVKAALETLDADEQIYIFKTHASPLEVFGVAGKTILVVRDGRDSLASFANYFIDSGANMTDLKYRLSAALRTPISTGDWVKFGKAAGRTTYKGLLERFGQRQRMVSSQLDRLLASESTYLNWSAMNRAWMQFDPEPSR